MNRLLPTTTNNIRKVVSVIRAGTSVAPMSYCRHIRHCGSVSGLDAA